MQGTGAKDASGPRRAAASLIAALATSFRTFADALLLFLQVRVFALKLNFEEFK
jgi:hypothetical protein